MRPAAVRWRVYWFRRPPYLRYAAAALVLVGAAWVELRGPQTVLHPFAAEPLPAGAAVEGAAITWREVPAGLLPPVGPGAVLARPVQEGSPLLPEDVALGRPRLPAGWWAVEVPLPVRATAGQAVQLVIPGQSGRTIPGIVLEPASHAEAFGLTDLPGLVAVAGDDAPLVALASRDGTLAVLVEP